MVTTTECTFDAHPEIWDLGGTISAEAYNQNDPNDPILHEDQTLIVEITVRLTGRILHYLCGTQICVNVAFESCGTGPERDFHQWQTIEPCRAGGDTYVFRFELAPGTLPAGECGKQYELCISIGSKDCCGHVGFIFGSCKDLNISVAPADVNA